jgi:hypothetical protein
VKDEDLVPERRCKGGWNWVHLPQSERERRMERYGVIERNIHSSEFDGGDEKEETSLVGDVSTSSDENGDGLAWVDGCNQEGDNHVKLKRIFSILIDLTL